MLGVALASLFLFGILPLANLLARSLWVGGSFTLEHYAEAFSRPRLVLLLDSLGLAGTAAFVAAVAGIAIAFFVVKSTIPLRGAFVPIFSAPLLFPPYVLANGWFQLLGRQGLLPKLIGALGGPGDAAGIVMSNWLFGFPGGVLVLSTAVLPITLLLSIAAIGAVNPRLEEAARVHASWPRVVKSITLPLAIPAIALATVLALLLVMGEYAAPSFLRLKVFSVESFTQLSAFYDPGGSVAAWLPMLILVAASMLVASRIIGPGDRHFRWLAPPAPQISLGAWMPVVFGALTLVAVGAVLLPCSALLIRGFSGSWLAALSQAWILGRDSLGWGMLYASVAASLVTAIGFLFGYVSQRRSFPGSGLLEPTTLTLFALPGPLLGFSVAVTWNTPATQGLYASSLLLLSALSMQYMAVGQLGFASGLAQMSPSLEEAAQIAGARRFRRMRWIVLPLQWRTIAGVWMLSFVLCLRDTTLPLLLSPPGRDTLSVRTLTLMANGSDDVIAILGLFSIVMAAIPAGIVLLWLRSKLP